MCFTGKFPKNLRTNIPKVVISLIMCKSCKLVQLDRNFNPKYLYDTNYGYRTGINETMTKHVKDVVKESVKIVKLKKKDAVLDIASNDGTLLNFYKKNIFRVGIDPLIKKYKNQYKNINFGIQDFFSYKAIQKKKINKKFKIITALSMFYDLPDPNQFLEEVKKVLDKEGIFVLEHADLLSIIKNCQFDTICHEHLEYYSTKVIIELMNKNELRVFNLKSNTINGGSMRYYICHKDSKYKNNDKIINKVLRKEMQSKLDKPNTFSDFFKLINVQKKKLVKLINRIIIKKKIIHGYGASTKGNVLLQYFGISNNKISYIADRNPQKVNLYTPGTKIKIVSESFSRMCKPNYYLVLPWHFKKEIILREKKTIKEGSRLIFPLPKMKIV
jgi:2-polyprenyl-3-methyl-5-hydroxy-6-metoxy-1,4-benzoquinol methylase